MMMVMMDMSESKIGKCYWCVSFDELADGEFFCNRYNEIIGESKVVDEEICEDWVGDVE